MKAITICQPFAELIARGEKLVENRTWQTHYRGPLAIHAGLGKSWLANCPGFDVDEARQLPRGVIVATCQLIDCLPIEALTTGLIKDCWSQSPHAHGPWCWLLAGVQPLEEPIPATGRQSLWQPSPALLSRLTR